MPIQSFDPPSPFASDEEWERFERDIRELIQKSSKEDAEELEDLLRNAKKSRELGDFF